MKLQVAIDRVTLGYAFNLARQLDDVVDIIEFGTSLVKDYGLVEIGKRRPELTHAQLLLDLKTFDEGPYEFEKGFDAKGDILTVMGAASSDTLQGVYDVTRHRQGEMFIDLMETTDQKVNQIAGFENVIYGIHHSHDATAGFNAVSTVEDFHKKFPKIKRISVAGGIDLATAKRLADQGIAESVIVGSKIIKTEDPVASAKQFMEVLK
ncbi:orotidine 5'-phosphate decarboxylase / HUMPS family protein [Lentilactobacillus raoultii]|uniref:Orotidine 5'-phosphate decarboxylase / HUMPS family protein n=1 Tax=Lentilactobacillus raoultii TaxID=1987503 RepID=A0ABW3PK06_9LACO|nr:orotidine 5'-phosphate decarboxylase / HUMPS family protein [Lentilactobacillus raoultii]